MYQIYFIGVTLFMFHTVFLSIIRSSTVHTARGICQRDTAICLLAGTRWNWFHLVPASKQSAVSVWHMPVSVCTVLNCWWWTQRPSETCRVSGICQRDTAVCTVLNCWWWTQRPFETFFLIFCWPYISMYLFININQLDALNFIISLFQASTC